MGIMDSVKSLGSSATWKGLASGALDYGSKALNFVSPFAGAAADLGLGIWNSRQQYKQAQGLSTHSMRLNKQYNEWLIPYQLGQEFEFASRYAKNSPSWNVKGLRKAGLNPILAASGGFSGGNAPYSSVGSVGSGGSTSPSLRMDVLSSINAHKQNQLLDEQIKGQQIKNDNDKKNMGLSGRDATIARIASELGLTPDRVKAVFGVGDTAPNSSRPTDSKSDPSQRSSTPHSFISNRPSSSKVVGYNYLTDKLIRSLSTSDLSYDTRKLFSDSVKDISPLTWMILKPLIEPSVYRMPRPPRSNTTHNALRQFWRDERKRERDIHGWKAK